MVDWLLNRGLELLSPEEGKLPPTGQILLESKIDRNAVPGRAVESREYDDILENVYSMYPRYFDIFS